MRFRNHIRGSIAALTLLEVMLSVVIGTALMVMLMTIVVDMSRAALWLNTQSSAHAQAMAFRWYLARDLYYADQLKVEDRSGTRLQVSGSINSLYSVPEPMNAAGTVYISNTNRFSILYQYIPPSGSVPPELVRYGPAYNDPSGGLPTMLDPHKTTQIILASTLSAQPNTQVFSLDTNGAVHVHLEVQQLIKGLVANGGLSNSNSLRTVDINFVATPQRL